MNFLKGLFLASLLAAMALIFTAGGSRDSIAEVRELVICYLPNSATEEFSEHRGLIREAMSSALGIRVTEINVADYNAVVEAMRTGRADIANFGPVTYVQAARRANAEAIVIPAPFGDKVLSGYTTQIVVQAGSPIRTLADLRGKTFAFVDPSSTSGNYVPILEFMNAFPGTNAETFLTNNRFFSSVMFSGSHQNGVRAVIQGDIDAAPVASSILVREILSGRINENDVTIMHESQLIPGSPIAVRGSLPAELKQRIKEFYLNFNDPDYFLVMHGLTPEEKPIYVEAFDHEYDYVRDLMDKVMP